MHSTTSSRLIAAFVLVILAGTRQTQGLSCVTCIRAECPYDDPICGELMEHLQQQLDPLYYFNEAPKLPMCPDIDDETAWKNLENINKPCSEQIQDRPTCSLAHLKTRAGGYIFHANLMGCAKFDVYQRAKLARDSGNCDIITKETNASSQGKAISFRMEIEHCDEPSTLCWEKDNCIDYKLSEVKPFNQVHEEEIFRNWFFIPLVVIAVICFLTYFAFLAMDFYNYWKQPELPNRKDDLQPEELERQRCESSV